MNPLKPLRLVATLLILLPIGGCSKKESPTTPCKFDITIDEVGGTKVKYTITPSNQEAYYLLDIVSPGQPEYYFTAEEAVDSKLSQMDYEYQQYIKRGDPAGSFADVFFYKGTRTHRGKYLPADMDNRLLVSQVDPDTREPIGDPVEVHFKTRPLHVDLDWEFEASIVDNVITITPTVMDAPYVWDFISKAKMEDDYGFPYIFLYELMLMYEEYSFTSYLSATGVSTWDLNQSVDPMQEGEEYVLAVVGYEDGEFTSVLEDFRFIYHKDGSVLLDY